MQLPDLPGRHTGWGGKWGRARSKGTSFRSFTSFQEICRWEGTRREDLIYHIDDVHAAEAHANCLHGTSSHLTAERVDEA